MTQTLIVLVLGPLSVLGLLFMQIPGNLLQTVTYRSEYGYAIQGNKALYHPGHRPDT